MENILGLFIGVGLSVSCGMRVFLPLFATGLFSKLGYLELVGKFSWLASDLALYALGTATLIELVAYLIPWVDTFLKALATPLAVMAGILITSSTLPFDDGIFKWGLAIIAGGGAAGTTQLVSTGSRGIVNTFTGGLGGIVFSIIETVSAIVTALISILVPILTILILIVMVFFTIKYRQKLWSTITNNKIIVLYKRLIGSSPAPTE